MPIIFDGSEALAYRDPTCFLFEGKYHLFFTVSEKDGGYLYNRVGHSVSSDLKTFSEPELITEKDNLKNFCSPGNVIQRGGEYFISVTSYPMPVPFDVCPYANGEARLFFIKTSNFRGFSSPLRIYPKGKDALDEGRMIDPFVLENDGCYHLFFKQGGVSHSISCDLEHWEYSGKTSGGENVCILPFQDKFIMLHSPQNGIGVKESYDLEQWTDKGLYTLDQDKWDFASGRLTAAFAMEIKDGKWKYAVFFHGSRADSVPETHGSASLALAYTSDFENYYF